jgi:hypothetical protein
VQNVNELRDRIVRSELQSALQVEVLGCIPGEKVNIILMCVVSLMMPSMRCTEHVRNFVL